MTSTKENPRVRKYSVILKYKNKTSLTFFVLFVFLSFTESGVFKVILLRSLRFSITVSPLWGYLVLSLGSHQFLLGLDFNRRALRVRLVTVVKGNSPSGFTWPFGWRFMKWTSCCLCVVREPFLGRPLRLKPRYHPLYLADTRAV